VQAVQQELAASQAAVEQVVTNTEPDLSLKKMRTPPIEQPFAPAGEDELAKAFNMLAEGNAIAVRDALQSFYDRLPAHSMSRFWVRMMQAVASWTAGRDQDALTYLHEVRNALFDPISPTRPHPGNMPQALSLYMLKEIDDVRGGQVAAVVRRPFAVLLRIGEPARRQPGSCQEVLRGLPCEEGDRSGMALWTAADGAEVHRAD